MMKTSFGYSLLHRVLIATHRLNEIKLIRRLWYYLWNTGVKRSTKPIRTTIHKRKVIVNFGYSYPMTARKNSAFNNPLVELVHQVFLTAKRPITLVDIGAAVGDTILLVKENCNNEVDAFFCVDGDTEFFGYLQENLGAFNEGKLFCALLSDHDLEEADLVRIHQGTASAQSKTRRQAVRLDALLLAEKPQHLDVLKIDVDGFDGKVLNGATQILTQFKPAVIFEWHPILYANTHNDPMLPFKTLARYGYQMFVWFDKLGRFSHFATGLDERAIELTKELCLRGNHMPDWHYDVVALHQNSEVSIIALAETAFAKTISSRY